MKIWQPCPDCNHTGSLPPLDQDSTLPFDVKRFFPRTCDLCHGAGSRMVEVDLSVEKKPAPDED